MATSSFSKNFVVTDQQAIKALVHSVENLVTIKIQKNELKNTEKSKQALLCAIKKQLASAN